MFRLSQNCHQGHSTNQQLRVCTTLFIHPECGYVALTAQVPQILRLFYLLRAGHTPQGTCNSCSTTGNYNSCTKVTPTGLAVPRQVSPSSVTIPHCPPFRDLTILNSTKSGTHDAAANTARLLLKQNSAGRQKHAL
jgi:hypothetical protein